MAERDERGRFMPHEHEHEHDRVTLDAAGQAEQVLQRLIHERQSLQSAVEVLATYRAVMSQVEAAEGQLRALRALVEDEHQDLVAVQERKAQQVLDIEAEMEALKAARERDMTNALAGLVAEQAEADQALLATRERLAALEAEEVERLRAHAAERARMQGEIAELQATYEQVYQALGRIAQAAHA